jgi:hypothetical protein
MRTTEMQDDDLNNLFAQARSRTPLPSPALMDRVLADALHHQPQPSLLPVRTVARRGLWTRVVRQIGGMPTVAGLCSAAVMGLAIGYTDPTTVDYLTIGFASDTLDTVDLFPTIDFLSTEG